MLDKVAPSSVARRLARLDRVPEPSQL